MSAAVVARARSVVGCRFRPHGRSPDAGFDCVGLVGWALGDIDAAPVGYPLRSDDRAGAEAGLLAAGLRPVAVAAAGDVVLLASGPGQLHLAIRSDDGVIHADAVARRVVERPGAPPWPILGAWRKS